MIFFQDDVNKAADFLDMFNAIEGRFYAMANTFCAIVDNFDAKLNTLDVSFNVCHARAIKLNVSLVIADVN